MADQSSTLAPPDRRQRFRSFMKRFNPIASAKAVINDGLILQSAGRSVFKRLAAGADLNFGSQQLVVGGIGSGKTTELLLAQAELTAHEQLLPLYVDVTAETDLTAVNSGALLASLGLNLWDKIIFLDPTSEIVEVHNELSKLAYGYEEAVWVDGEPQHNEFIPYLEDTGADFFHTINVPGKLKPPFPAIRRDVNQLAAYVSDFLGFLMTRGKEVVILFDGLDRLIKADQFWSVAEQDLRALKPLEISVLVAGPLSIMYSQGRQVKDYFDEVHYLPTAIADPKKSPFLFEVLRLRGAEELMRPDHMQFLCLASGGVLRDLISLARSAGENAYIDDADQIDGFHVARSIEQLGNSYLLGLGTRQKAILQKLQQSGSFAPSDSDSMELLVSPRVLEQSESRYEVHPALASVLPASPSQPE
jgi:hypothetical protein